ncbi:MAG: cytochrome c3 family protein [Candidatus Delongbacteria bacterium]
MKFAGLLLTLLAGAAWGLESPHGPLTLECSLCHSTEAWTLRSEPDFQHDLNTAWPLEGGHAQVACLTCHTDLHFQGTGTSCTSCHLDVHQGSLGEGCRECHSPERWLDSALLRRRHDRSQFPLTGAHGQLACDRCHSGSGAAQFAATPTECSDCHFGTWQSTLNPPHQASQLGTDCRSCHHTSRWNDAAGFQHESFPLTGAHVGTPCTACHVGGTFQGLPSDCYSCHQTEYLEGPDHVEGEYPTTCATCHSTTAWRPSSLNHDATDFPLTGAHRSVACAQCHMAQPYSSAPSDCWSCHQADFQAALNPDHQAGQYPQTCAVCHSTTAWQPASFDHGLTDFPLSGAHVGVSCAACHSNGQYTGTPSDCQSCHLDDYQATSNPNHTAADFPLACASCHSTASWTGATFNHDQSFFPIYSGEHRGEWSSCTDCHSNSASYAEFSCLGCHEHSRSEMDGEHDEVGGYSWESQACLQCHPNGQANDRLPRRQRTIGMDPRPRHPLR